MDQPTTTRRRFRIGLRTLLVVVTLAAVGTWVWTSMPLWVKGREQLDFEKSARQIKAGMTLSEAERLISKHRDWLDISSDFQGNSLYLARYYWPNAIYCISYVLQPRVGRAPDIIRSVEIFRLPAVPPGYQAQTKGGIRLITRNTSPIKPADAPLRAYIADFLDFVCSDRKKNSAIQYELIYSDPLK